MTRATFADALIADLTDGQLAQLAERLRPFLADREPDALLTPAEAAARLGVHAKTLTRAAKDGRVPGARRVGTGWRFDPATLDLHPVAAPPSVGTAPASRRAGRPGTSTATADAIRTASRRSPSEGER